MANSITIKKIGTIRSPFKELSGMPIQPTGAVGIRGEIEVDDAYTEALKDLDGFSHIILLYHFDKCGDYKPLVKPFLDENLRGLFATRAPSRPNPIGLSIVKLIGIEKNVLHIEDVDILDGTPLIDIKPYVPKFDYRKDVREGWLESSGDDVRKTRSDGRFT